jgi:hypothetical protein
VTVDTPDTRTPDVWPRRAHGADLADPGFPLAAVVLLTFVPYLWPMEHSGVLKYWDIGSHIAFCAGFAVVQFALWAFYRMLFPSPWYVPDPAGRYEAVLFGFCRIAIWAAIGANVYLLALVLPRIGGGVFAMKSVVAEGEGLFILTQLHVWFLGPYVAIGILRGERITRTLVVLGLLVLARAVLVGERLALLEFLLPLMVVLTLLGRIRIGWGRLVAIVGFVPVFFLSTEIFRSFWSKFADTAGGLSQFSLEFIIAWNLERFFSYYVDVTNKLYLTLSEQFFGQTSFWSVGVSRMLYRFGLSEFPDESILFDTLERFGVRSRELTNPGGLQTFLSDFGWWGIGVYVAFVVLLLVAHRSARLGAPMAYGIYPFLWFTFADLVRLNYLYESRAIFPLILFVGACIAARLVAMSDAGQTRPDDDPRTFPERSLP